MKNIKIIVLIIILALVSFFIVYEGSVLMNENSIERKLKELNYNKKSIDLIIKNNIDKYLIKKKIYSKTIEKALLENKFNKKYLETYSCFEYKDSGNFIDNLNKLTKLGYTQAEMEVLFDNLKEEDITILTSRENKEEEILKYCILDNFDINNYDRYVNYKKKNNNYDYKTIISYVNLNLDYDFYTHVEEALNKHSELVLINKYYRVDETYVPKDLKTLDISCASNSNISVVSVVKDTFENLCMDAKSIGLTIKAVSAYRSFGMQKTLYNGYLKNDPVEVVDTYSAREGYSEHQSGYAMDVYNVTVPYTSFGTTNEYKWVKENAHNYGFIIRYEQGKEKITGYQFEPWHLRYVGKNAASYIYNNKITLEEYIDGYRKGTIK